MKKKEKDENLLTYNLNFINGTFRDVLIPQKDFTNKKLILVKEELTKKEGDTETSLLPKASEEYLGVTFLYLGEDKEISPYDDESTKYIFEKNKIYRCVVKEEESTNYTWEEIELLGERPNIKEITTFDGIEGDTETLYMLNTAYDSYKAGMYIYDKANKVFKIKFEFEGSKLNQSVIETEYNTSTSYVVDNTCTYKGDLYKCKTATTGEFNKDNWNSISFKKYIIDYLMPVGYVYTQYKGMADPNTLYEGTTWEVDSSLDGDIFYVNSSVEVGTEIAQNIDILDHILTKDELPTHTHTYEKSNTTTESHTLTKNELPAHNHTLYLYSYYGTGYHSGQVGWACGDTDRGAGTGTTSNTGGGQGHTHDITLTETETESTGESKGHKHEVAPGAKINGSTVKLWKRTA